MTKEDKRITASIKANRRTATHRQEARSKPLLEYKDWAIVRFDGMNIALSRKGEKATRYYSSLGGALEGLRKEIGFASKDLNAAIEAWDELGRKIEEL